MFSAIVFFLGLSAIMDKTTRPGPIARVKDITSRLITQRSQWTREGFFAALLSEVQNLGDTEAEAWIRANEDRMIEVVEAKTPLAASQQLATRRVMDDVVVLNFGGGLNSTAMLLEWVRRGNPGPHLILFGDTGGEKPETYAWLGVIDAWLREEGLPPIRVARYRTREGAFVSLEQHSLDTKRLPSLAYGFKSCSQRFKRDPCLREVNRFIPAREVWAQGGKVTQLIGYDTDEPHRKKRADERRAMVEKGLLELAAWEAGGRVGPKPQIEARALSDYKKFNVRYPLLEWDMDREDCLEICLRELGMAPPKSSCFFCPANKPREILDLKQKHPDLLARALKIESNAESNAGHEPKLGRYYAWKDVVKGDVDSSVAPEIACECTDGE